MQVIVENPNTIVIDVDQGRAGRGIQNITYTEVSGQYFLIVTYTDGTTETLGPLVVTGGAVFLLGGNTGSIPYQSAPNTTVFLPIGAQNQVVVAGATAPQYTSALTGLTINNSPIGNVTKSTGGFTDVTADSVQFNTAATEANAVGKFYWDAAQGTLDLGLLGGNVISRIGQSLVAYVTNAEAVTITKGQVVYLFGAQGDRATVKLAYNTSDATSAKTFGVVAENIPANGTGFVMCQGVLEGLNLGAFTAGDTLYLGATPGSLTATKPYAPNHLVYVGLVERANPGNGQLYVKVQNGYELDEIHDVQIVNPQNGQTILYDASTSLWKNANLTAGTGISVTNGAASVTIGNTGVLSFSGGTTGLTPSTSTTGAVTLGGTLATTNGGTGLTSFTANRVFYASSTSAIGQSANLTFDGTTLTANALTTTSTVTLNGGTANGVLYLNGSKVATSGSALTFDGTSLGVGTASPQTKLHVAGTGTTAISVERTSAAIGGRFEFISGDSTNLINTTIAKPINFGQASATVMTLDTSGYLGLGVTAPLVPLDIRATQGTLNLSAGSDPLVNLNILNPDTTAGTGPTIAFSSYYSSTNAGPLATIAVERAIGSGSSSNGLSNNIIFRQAQTASTALTERMRITSTGGLAIGTTTDPSTGGLYVAGNTTLGDASTDTVQVNGYVGVGIAPSANVGLFTRPSGLTTATQIGVLGGVLANSAATALVAGVYGEGRTAASAFTVSDLVALYANNTTKGAGSTITNQHGVYIADQTQGTNNYGITSAVSSGANKWNIYASGTAANYFAGNVGIGYTTTPDAPLTLDVASGGGTANTSYDAINLSSGSSTYPAKIKVEQGSSSTIHSLSFWTSNAAAPTEKFKLNPTEAVFNDPGNDYDFRVESDTDTHALFLEGSSGNVGIGTSSPGSLLHLNANNAEMRLSEAGTYYGSIKVDSAGGLTIGSDPSNVAANSRIIFGVDGTERARLDSSGNLGLGVTPSAWGSGYKAIQNLKSSWFGTTSRDANFGANVYVDAVGYKYIDSSFATNYTQYQGAHSWYTAPSGTAGAAITFTQAMTLTQGGNLAIGQTSSALQSGGTGITLYGSSNSEIKFLNSSTGSAATDGTALVTSSLDFLINNREAGAITFGTSNTERARIDSSGNLGIGTSSPTNRLSVDGNANITGNTTLGDASTDTVTVNGYMGVGGAGNSQFAVSAVSTALTGGDQRAFRAAITATATATTRVVGVSSSLSTAAAAFTVGDMAAFYAFDNVKGAGSTITNQHGLYIADQTQGTNNYGITSVVSSGTNKWNIYASGTAANYFAGTMGVGTNDTTYQLHTRVDDATTNAVTRALAVSHTTTGTAANGIGSGIAFQQESTTGSLRAAAYIDSIFTDATDASLASALTFTTRSGGSLTERMRLDSSGNLGLGVTPSAWSSAWRAYGIAGGATLAGRSSNTDELYLSANSFNDGAWKYIASDFATQYYQDAGTHVWRTAPSGTAGAAITFTERASIGLTEMVVNEPGADYDFRVESDTNTHALFVDAGNSRVGVNQSVPDTAFSVNGIIQSTGESSAVSIANGAAANVITPNRGFSYINISRSDTASYGLLLLVFRTTTTLEIVSTVSDKTSGTYSASVSGTALQITNSSGSTVSFYASGICMAFGTGD